MMAVATTIAALYGSSLDYNYFEHQQRSSSSSSSSPSSLFSSSSSPPDDYLTPSLRNTGDHFLNQSPVSVINGYGTKKLLFKRFVTHVFGACVSNSNSRLNLDDDENNEDELMFSMDDDVDSDNYENQMLLDAQLKYNVFNDDLVVKAFYQAAKAHKGQMRANGDPYLVHCVETAGLLATIGANAVVVAAGLLHDTIDDSFMSYEYILDTFGAGLADLVKGVSRLSELSKLARESNTATKLVEADRMHTMFLGMVDARAVLIKLADRLHNMMTLDALPLSKQYRFAKETMEIFAPLANRLGIVSWKEQLENLCFKYINPERYTDLSSQLLKSFNEAMVNSAAEKLEEALKDGSVCYHVLYGRHKSLYSVHCKMLKKKLSMDEIHDVHGLRLIVENKEDCYKALKVVHGLWSEVPGKFKDYINQPKCNGYRSLHTVVKGEGLVPLEVQIRTKEMHSQAEFGFAAHWRYKEGDCMHSSFVLQMVEWARWVVTWQCETMMKDQSGISFADVMKPPCKFPFHSEDCPHSYKPSCVSDGPVFVIVIENDKMSVQEFPADATVKDVLDRAGEGSYRWSPYGFSVKQELIAKLNHEAVSDPIGKLRMGDVVELTPKISDKSLIEKREEIQRMYESGLSTTSTGRASDNRVGWRR